MKKKKQAKSKRSKIFSVLLSAGLIWLSLFPMMPTQSHAEATAGTTDNNITLAISNVGNQEVLSGQVMRLKLDIQVSLGATDRQNITIRIKAPEDYLNYFSSASFQTATTSYTKGDGYQYLNYTFPTINGGFIGSITFDAYAKTRVTPDNYQMPFIAEVLDADGNVLQSAGPVEIKQNANSPRLTKTVAGDYYTQNVQYTGPGATAYPNPLTYIVGNPNSSNPNLIDTTGYTSLEFYFNYGNSSSGSVGLRTVQSAVIKDVMPDGAVFDPTKNPGWKLDPEDATGKTLLYTFQSSDPSGTGERMAKLKLDFPGASILPLYTNTSTATFTPTNPEEGEDTLTSSSNAKFYITNKKNPVLEQSYLSKMVMGSSSRLASEAELSKPIIWQVQYTNRSTGGNPFEEVEIFDEHLDARLEYQTIRLVPPYIPADVRVDVIYQDAQGQEHLIQGNVRYLDGGSFNIPSDAVRVGIRTVSGSQLMPNDWLVFEVTTRVKDVHAVEAPTKLTNDITASATSIYSGDKVKESHEAYVSIIPYDPAVVLYKYFGGQAQEPNIGSDEARTVYLSLEEMDRNWGNANMIETGDSLKDVQIVDLLPPGGEYAGNASQEPTTIEDNYQGTGRTALIWDLGDLKKTSDSNSVHFFATISFQVKGLPTTSSGSFVNDAYALWSNNGSDPDSQEQQIKGLSGSKWDWYNGSRTSVPKSDIYDFDKDSNTEESILTSQAQLNYEPTLEMLNYKRVKSDSSPNYGAMALIKEIDKTAQYQLTIMNRTTADVDHYTLIDILPYGQDQEIVNTNGVQTNRDSDFAVFLKTKIGLVDDRFEIQYTTDRYDTVGEYVSEAQWKTQSKIGDWSKVTAFKIVLKEGASLGASERVDFEAQVQVPDFKELKGDMKAQNTTFASFDGKSFVEGNQANLKVVKEFPEEETLTVIFDPGAHGTFQPVVHDQLKEGTKTPIPPTPTGEEGWIFLGWSPVVTDTVTQNITYVAQWGKDENFPYEEDEDSTDKPTPSNTDSNSQDKEPETGDPSNTWGWMALTLLSLSGVLVAGTGIRRGRMKEDSKH